MIAPDTLVILNRSAQSTDYTPLFSGIAASVLVAGMAWYSTRKQSQIAVANTTTQREIADRAVTAQLEIARRANVIEARREWTRELRNAVAAFQSVAAALGLLGRTRLNSTFGSKEKYTADFAEFLRLQSVIVLLLDKTKAAHRDVAVTLQAVNQLCLFPAEVEAARKMGADDVRYKEGRMYGKIGDAFATLDYQVGILVEAAWDKIKRGE